MPVLAVVLAASVGVGVTGCAQRRASLCEDYSGVEDAIRAPSPAVAAARLDRAGAALRRDGYAGQAEAVTGWADALRDGDPSAAGRMRQVVALAPTC